MASLPHKKVYSQFGEDGIIEYIFQQIGTRSKFFVDYGAGGYGNGFSNTRLLKESGWKGLMVDTDTRDDQDIIKEFITPFNAAAILVEHDCPDVFDFFNIDLDSFDYDIMDNVLQRFTPRVICCEFNSGLPPESCLKLQYEEGYIWDETSKFGFSFGAAKKLFAKYGYEIIYNQMDLNLFAVADHIIYFPFPEVTATQKRDHPTNESAIFVEA